KEIDVQMNLIRVFTEELAVAENEYERLSRNAAFLAALLQRYNKMDKPMYQPFPHDFQDIEIRNMNERLNTLLYEQSELRKKYTDQAPQIVEANAQIEDLWKKMMVIVRNRIDFERTQMESAEQRVTRTKQRLDELVARNQELTEGWARLQRIEKDIELTQANYEVFSKKYEEARIGETERESLVASVQIINRPVLPKKPVFPRAGVVIPVGVITGFLLGFALAYIREFFDHTFKVPAEVAEHLNVPVIGSVPFKRWF
ncbi:MAG TPA: GNVR domain-containing protein, partial [Candidatus Hydrogenedentes bacterium]|nr:GNVR domain-containing protein [Candidatus Hydrogenedentota bacterium]